jgi:hypothetical protein
MRKQYGKVVSTPTCKVCGCPDMLLNEMRCGDFPPSHLMYCANGPTHESEYASRRASSPNFRFTFECESEAIEISKEEFDSFFGSGKTLPEILEFVVEAGQIVGNSPDERMAEAIEGMRFEARENGLDEDEAESFARKHYAS